MWDLTRTATSPLKLGVANGKCETLRDRETSVFLSEPETFWLFRLRDRDFKEFWVRAREVQTLRIRATDLVEKYTNEFEWARTKVLQRSLCCKPLYKTSDLKISQQSINSIIFLAMTYFQSGGCAWSFPFDIFWLMRCHLQLQLSRSRQKKNKTKQKNKQMRGCIWAHWGGNVHTLKP